MATVGVKGLSDSIVSCRVVIRRHTHLDRVVSRAREADNRCVVVAISHEDGDVDDGQQTRPGHILDGDQDIVDPGVLAVEPPGGRQPTRPAINDKRPGRRRLPDHGEHEAIIGRRVGVDGCQSADLRVWRLVLVRTERVGRLTEPRWTVVHVD